MERTEKIERNIKLYTLGSLGFLFIMSLGGSIGGFVETIFYPLSFILPSAALIFIAKKEETPPLLSTGNPWLLLPLTAPSLSFIFVTAYLVAGLIYHLFGSESNVPVTGVPSADIITLAIAPALLEELLFRYVPLKMIAPYSKKTALIVSSLFFALVHGSFFSIPHAFVAGIIFMTLDLVFSSPLPSVILHLANNLLSIAWSYCVIGGCTEYIIFPLATLSAISVIAVIIMRKKYLNAFYNTFDKADKIKLHIYALALAVPTLLAAVTEIF